MQKAESQSESFSPLAPLPFSFPFPLGCRINVQESKANTLKLCTDSGNGNNNELPPRPLETLRLLRAPAFTHPPLFPPSLSLGSHANSPLDYEIKMDDGRNENGIFNELAQPAKAKRAEKTMAGCLRRRLLQSTGRGNVPARLDKLIDRQTDRLAQAD